MNKQDIIKEYEKLLIRFNNGFDYINEHQCDENSKEYKVWSAIVKRLSELQPLYDKYT